MQWEHLTSKDFETAVKRSRGVCVLAMGVIERHGDHLPIGVDVLNSHRIACEAAKIEPAVVFPQFYYGQIYEARCYPGTIALKPEVLLAVIQNTLDEIGRNGFKKIILLNGHGGNWHLLRFLAQCSLAEAKPYCLYVPERSVSQTQAWKDILETDNHAHGCECETSISMANLGPLVKMKSVWKNAAEPRHRLKDLPPQFSGIGWYADYPEHYAGDARPASAAKGEKLRALRVDELATFIAAVKKDKASPALNQEFHRRVAKIGK